MIISNNKIHNLLFVFLIVLFVFIITLIFLSLDRGFNFVDEGLYLLQFKYVGVYRVGVRNYDIIITKLTNWMHPGIIAYRWMSLILTVLSSLILAFGLHKWLATNIRSNLFFKNFFFVFVFNQETFHKIAFFFAVIINGRNWFLWIPFFENNHIFIKMSCQFWNNSF